MLFEVDPTETSNSLVPGDEKEIFSGEPNILQQPERPSSPPMCSVLKIIKIKKKSAFEINRGFFLNYGVKVFELYRKTY